ncbi:MAG: tetratricopeptide repeat protein [Treponema sp.]|jgi:tetratricopeptide (TPR) repeat protein|nr:tetratricopeptide repeat protein [Treponema sp.]
MKVKEVLSGIVIVAVVFAVVFGVYSGAKKKSHRDLAKRIAELSPRGGPPETVEGLSKAIALYEDQITLNLKEGVQTASYWKILATRYIDKKLYNEALKALERAVYYNNEDPTLFYLTGLSAGVVAKSSLDFPGTEENLQMRYFTLAEQAYLRSIELDPDYPKPRYGLGILYSFELGRPLEALPHLEHYAELLPRDMNALFALARVYYQTGNNERALEIYDRIIREAKDQNQKAEAQKNREFILEMNNG